MAEPHQVRAPAWSPWRTVVWFGLVSLAGDVVYEGARSVTGPYLGALGASALVVGLVTGAGEAVALGLRLVSGPLADRSGRHWRWTWVGYALTAASVPLMALAPFVGAAGLALAATLVVLERTGKAVRSPAKTALLAHAARAVGGGRGFGVHKAMDQLGAFLGPLLVAATIALTARTWPAFAVLAVPAAVVMVLVSVLRRRVPDPGQYAAARPVLAGSGELPPSFLMVAGACAGSTLGLMTFGVISFHLAQAGLVATALVPVVYAGAMGVGAVSALGSGVLYDRWGPRVLLGLPFAVAAVPALALAPTVGPALAGIAVWGAATGVLDSTVKALVADLVPAPRLATAYGLFAAFQGAAALVGGALAGWLYAGERTDLVLVVGAVQVVSLVVLVRGLRRAGYPPSA